MPERTSTLPRSERLPDGRALVHCQDVDGAAFVVPFADIFEAWRFEDVLLAIQKPPASKPALDMPATCQGCGGPLPPRKGRGRAIYCTRACGRQARLREKRSTEPRSCLACSADISHLTLKSRCCSEPCATWARRHPGVPRWTPRSCPTCGTDMTYRASQARYCSKRCSDIARGQVLAEPYPERTCALEECGVIFRPKSKRQRCCCEAHGSLHSHREYRAAGREVREEWGDARRERYHRRRALKKAASTGAPVRFTEIAERDRWICGLCRKPVDPTLAWPDPMSPSLDHVIPLTKGGAHDPANVQLAHLYCNTTKNNRGGGEQLALIG